MLVATNEIEITEYKLGTSNVVDPASFTIFIHLFEKFCERCVNYRDWFRFGTLKFLVAEPSMHYILNQHFRIELGNNEYIVIKYNGEGAVNKMAWQIIVDIALFNHLDVFWLSDYK